MKLLSKIQSLIMPMEISMAIPTKSIAIAIHMTIAMSTRNIAMMLLLKNQSLKVN
jgi:hypothetical protein